MTHHLAEVYAMRAFATLGFISLVAWMVYSALPRKPKNTLYVECRDSLDAAMQGIEDMINEGSPVQAEPKPEPLRINSTIKNSPEISEAMTRACNPSLALDFQAMVPSDRIWVYNVSRMTHELDHHTLGHVKIPGNTSKKRYALYTSFPSVIMSTKEDLNSSIMTMFPESGKRFVMDLINPDNLGLDQSFDSKYHTSVGQNLSKKGVFWSMHNPPKKAEVDAAVTRMETRYRDLLERAEIAYENLRISGDRVVSYMAEKECDLPTAITCIMRQQVVPEITPEHHAAANYFKVTTPWHPVLS